MRLNASSAEEGGSAMLAALEPVAATGIPSGAHPETIENQETDA